MSLNMRIETLYKAVGVVSALLVFGCQGAPPPAVTEPQLAAAAPAPGPMALLPESARQMPAPRPTTAQKHVDHKPSSMPNPIQLVGLDENEARTLLGAPAVVEDHAPARIWQFRKQDCVLSVALYPDVDTRVFRILSYEVKSDEHDSGANKQHCAAIFGSIVATE